MNIFERFKAVFTSPSKLFEAVKDEDYKPTLKYYLIVVIGLSIVSFFISIGTRMKNSFGLTTTDIIQNAIVSWILTIIGIFVMAFFIGLAFSWFGGNKSWSQGMKTIVYPQTIGAVVQVIFAVIGTFMASSIDIANPTALLALMTSSAGMAIIALAVIIGIGVFVWQIIIFVIGARINHGVSTGVAIGGGLIAIIFSLIVMSIIGWVITLIGLIKQPNIPTF